MTTSNAAAVPYSQRLGAITPAQFQAALDTFDLGGFLSAEPITGGLFGQNVFVSSTNGRYVLRGCPHWQWQFEGERFFCRHVHERTAVPAPWPYLASPDTTIFGWPFAIMRRMPGISPNDDLVKTLPADGQCALARTLGAALAGLATATMPHIGGYDHATEAIKAVPGGLCAERMAWMQGMLADAERFCPATIAPDRGWIDDIVGAARDRALQEFQPTVATADFNSGNMVVERIAGGWRCSGVFDFAEYSAGDLELSLARPLAGCHGDQAAFAQAFLHGYVAQRPLREHACERLALYVLGDRLCIWNYGHSQAQWFPPELSFRAFAGPAIAAVMELVSGHQR